MTQEDDLPHVDTAASAVKAPAIALLCVGGLGALMALGSLIMSRFVLEMAKQDSKLDEQGQRALEIMYGGGALLIHGFGFLASALAIAGAIAMLNRKSRGLGIAGCIAAMVIPSCCCCLAGIPAGIWGLVVLSRDDVKQAFARQI